jgi:hypothetical protein
VRLSSNGLTPWSGVLVEGLIIPQPLTKSPLPLILWNLKSQYGVHKNPPLSWTKLIQYIASNLISIEPISILSAHLCLGLPSSSFSRFSSKTLYEFTLTTRCIASDTTWICYYFLKHYMFRSSRSWSGDCLYKNLKFKVKMQNFARTHKLYKTYKI